MRMAYEFTTQLLTFDIIWQGIVLMAIVLMLNRTRELYSLSMQKGLRYLNYALVFYLVSFGVRFLWMLIDYFGDGMYGTFKFSTLGIILIAVNMYAATMGGFYLAFCLVWRNFEKPLITGEHKRQAVVMYIAALLIVSLDIWLILNGSTRVPFIFFAAVIGALLYAIVANHKLCCRRGSQSKDMNPFISLVAMGMGVYIAFFIEDLVFPYLFTIHFYMSGLVTIFTLTFMYHVLKVIR
jgi:hypothetical protein